MVLDIVVAGNASHESNNINANYALIVRSLHDFRMILA